MGDESQLLSPVFQMTGSRNLTFGNKLIGLLTGSWGNHRHKLMFVPQRDLVLKSLKYT